MTKTKKITYLLIGFLCCLSGINAQEIKEKAEEIEKTEEIEKVEPEQKKRDKYIVSSGEETLVVGAVDRGLKDPDARFLLKDKRFLDEDLHANDYNYQSLEEASYDVNRLLKILESGKRKKDENGSLSMRAIQAQRERKKQVAEEKESKPVASQSGNTEVARKRYGNKPSYFINGIETTYDFIEALFPDEILGKKIKVENTQNPNGEIWYSVPEEVVYEIGLLDRVKNATARKQARESQQKTNKKKSK